MDDVQLFNRALTDSEAIHYSNPAVLGVTNLIIPDRINIYPNPVTSTCTVQIPEHTDNASLYLSNQLGQIIEGKTLTGNDTQIDLSHLPEGMYVVRIMIGEESFFRKIIVVHKQ